MPETLPVIRVDRVTAAVTVCPGPPTVMDVLLTAVTLPISTSVPVPPEPVPGSAPPPGWLLPPGTTGVRAEGWPAAPGVAPEEPASSSTASTIPLPAAAARSAITSRRTGRSRRAGGPPSGQPGGRGDAVRGPPGAPPPGWPPPGGSSPSGHRSSGQSPLPGPAEPEGRCDIGCSLPRLVTSLDWAPAPRCPAR